MAHADARLPAPSETTDLERRVLAHERVLQALIAYMARSEPRFVEHLQERFVEPMGSVSREHDHRDADDYAEEFIRAVIRLGVAQSPAGGSETKAASGGSSPAKVEVSQGPPPETPALRDRVEVRQRSGVWEVRVDGVFHGDYLQQQHAVAAAALQTAALR
jgi:hypothetical protein